MVSIGRAIIYYENIMHPAPLFLIFVEVPSTGKEFIDIPNYYGKFIGEGMDIIGFVSTSTNTGDTSKDVEVTNMSDILPYSGQPEFYKYEGDELLNLSDEEWALQSGIENICYENKDENKSIRSIRHFHVFFKTIVFCIH